MHFHHHHFGGRGGGRRHFGHHGFFGGPFGSGLRGGGPGGLRTARMLGSGELQLLILRLLAEKPRHGYEIIKALEEHSSGVYVPSPGMVYPALTYLEETGYASASAEGSKKLYTLTEAGSAHLKENHAAAEEVWNQLALFGRKLSRFQRQFAEDEEVAEHFGSDRRDRDRREWHALKAEFRAVRDELKAALYEKLDASLEEKQRVLAVLRRAIDEIRGR